MKINGSVIATDLDGTLFYPKKIFRLISHRNTRFLCQYIKAGGKVLLVSGRNHFNLEKVSKFIDPSVDYAGCNGSFLVINHKMISKSLIDNIKLKKFLSELNGDIKPSGVLLMDEEYSFVIPTKSFGWNNRIGFSIYLLFQGPRREKVYRSDELLYERIDHGKVFKVMLFYGIRPKHIRRCANACQYLKKKYPEFAFANLKQCIEVTNIDANKANAIKQYLDFFKIKRDNVIVVGDSGNDISMFQSFKNSFCMKRASTSISNHAKYIIKGVWKLKSYIDFKKGEINL